MRESRQEAVCEYRSLNADAEMIWCNTTIYLIESGGHLTGFVYVKNIEEKPGGSWNASPVENRSADQSS